MFLDIDLKNRLCIAATDDSGNSVSYGDLCDFCDQISEVIEERALVFLLSENCIGSLLGYVGFLNNHVVPLILSAKTERGLYDNLMELYHPSYIWAPNSMVDELGFPCKWTAWGYSLLKTGMESPKLYDKLSMLLPTSGSTGSPKLVRHSYRNIEANAYNVLRMFQLTPDEKAMAVLPMHYTMGLSVISSHLKAGASLLLSGRSLLDGAFWKTLKEATSFTGVPYSYELLMKMRFMRMDLPNLRVISQGGGKLTEEMFKELALYAQRTGKKFIPTYGQSECTARMAYLPSELALEKTCSIGVAEPGGQLSIIDNNGVETFEGVAEGEMVYRGENVTLGYSYCADDLSKGDENNGIMYTGDLARRDSDGCYYIVGRLKRFLKIFGLRIGLDEIEMLVKSNFDTDCACSGTDEMLVVYITNPSIKDTVSTFIEDKTHLFHKNITITVVDALRRNEAGKVMFS